MKQNTAGVTGRSLTGQHRGEELSHVSRLLVVLQLDHTPLGALRGRDRLQPGNVEELR